MYIGPVKTNGVSVLGFVKKTIHVDNVDDDEVNCPKNIESKELGVNLWNN